MFGEIRPYLGLIHDKNKMYPISSYNKCPVMKKMCIESKFDLILGISTKQSNHNVLSSGLFCTEFEQCRTECVLKWSWPWEEKQWIGSLNEWKMKVQIDIFHGFMCRKAAFEVSRARLWSLCNEKKIGSCFTSVSSVPALQHTMFRTFLGQQKKELSRIKSTGVRGKHFE